MRARLLVLATVIALGTPQIALGSTIDLDRWADAIWKAECGTGPRPACSYLYGIRSVKYKDESEARAICKRTVFNTLVKYRESRCNPGEDDLTCLSHRYCPVGSDTDNGTCQYWKRNVLHYLK